MSEKVRKIIWGNGAELTLLGQIKIYFIPKEKPSDL